MEEQRGVVQRLEPEGLFLQRFAMPLFRAFSMDLIDAKLLGRRVLPAGIRLI